MAALKNPYLSNQTENLLLRKNFNIIKSPQKSALYPAYTSNQTKHSYQFTTINTNNHESSTSIGNKSSSMSRQNPFSTKTLGQRNQNYPYYHANAPSFYTQTYLPSASQKQLPFPSYNRPTSNRGTSFSSNKMSKALSFSRRNLAVSNVGIMQSSSLEKNITGPYRPHFVSPKNNNEWNTQKWKAEFEKKERNNLKLFGPEALRYQSKIDPNFNNEYYSTSNLNTQMKYKTNKVQKTQYQKRIKNILSFDDDLDGAGSSQPEKKKLYPTKINPSSFQNASLAPKDPDTYYQPKNHVNIKNFSDIHQQSEVQLHNRNSESMVEDYQSFAKDNDANQNHFMSKYDDKNQYKRRKGPLDLNAFDSESSKGLMNQSKQRDLDLNMYGSGTFGKPQRSKFRQEESSVFRANLVDSKRFSSNERYNKNSKLKQNVENIPQRDFPQRIQYSNKIYYRIKINEQKK